MAKDKYGSEDGTKDKCEIEVGDAIDIEGEGEIKTNVMVNVILYVNVRLNVSVTIKVDVKFKVG